MIIYIFVYLVLVLWIMYLLKVPPFGTELFTSNTPNYIEADDTEFRGINLLGLNSDDAHFAAENVNVCREICQRNPECKGYSYYQPGQRCYMFSSGDFVRERPGFKSGKKLT
ncbi:hypothetical protein LCGC14_2072760 [marine sediment metagenome]|uniref:Apple domain-containing protein n=2 Tax=root TaxID=1 RepID=A0A0F9HEY4_9ZZZZ